MLEFRSLKLEDIRCLKDYFSDIDALTCDYSVGTTFMYSEMYQQEIAYYKDTVFFKLLDTSNRVSFSLPVGKLPMIECLQLLKEFADTEKIDFIISWIPEDWLTKIPNINDYEVTELSNWHDYLYDAKSFGLMSGSKYAKVRNHVNNFKNHFTYSLFDFNKVPKEQIISFLHVYILENPQNESSLYENAKVEELINNFALFDFKGLVMKMGEEIVGFCIGEIINETLFVHVEKALKVVNGIFQVLATSFVASLLETNIKYVNREDDAHDSGLQRSKMSYQPIRLLKRYEAKLKV
jgi:hypothetical protein